MVTPTTAFTDAELLVALEPVFGTGVSIVARRDNTYTSSSRSEILTLRAGEGPLCEFLLKHERPGREPGPVCRHGIGYCAMVYAKLIASMPLSHLNAAGLIQIGADRSPALIVEHLDNALRVGEAPEVSGILSAAEWCGAFHRWAEPRHRDDTLSFLERYDAGYYLAWGDRLLSLTSATGTQEAWVDGVVAAIPRMSAALVDAPTTVIHGEMSPQNVLWREGMVYPVDWESAAIGPGEIDLAALLFGWPIELVERSVSAYWAAREETPGDDFATRWAAATLYTAIRWVAPPSGPDDQRFALALVRLEETARALGMIP